MTMREDKRKNKRTYKHVEASDEHVQKEQKEGKKEYNYPQTLSFSMVPNSSMYKQSCRESGR